MMKRFLASRFFSRHALPAVLALSIFSSSALVIVSFGHPASLQAQARGPVQRIVHGKVEGKDGNGIKGAVVYLQDTKTSSVKTAIADDDGSYRFVQLAQSTDYQLWAKNNGAQSKTKSISSFDSKNDMLINLTIE